MKKLSRKLFISIFAVLLSIVAIGTTTFAWFTLSNQAKVDPIEFNTIDSTGNMLISINGTDWLTQLTATEVESAMKVYANDNSVTIGNFAWNAVTTINGSEFQGYDPVTNTYATPGSDNAPQINENYLSFVIYFKNTSNRQTADATGTFQANINMISNTVTRNLDAMVLGNAVGTGYKCNFVNAMRYSLSAVKYAKDAPVPAPRTITFPAPTIYAPNYVEKNDGGTIVFQDTFKTGTTVLQGEDYTTNPGLSYIHNLYKTNLSYRTAWGGDDVVIAEGNTEGLNNNTVESASTHGTNVKAITLPTPTSISNALTIDGDTMTAALGNPDATANTVDLMDAVNGSEVVAVRFNIWVEGWDADCFDVLLENTISIGMNFRISTGA